MSLVINWSLVTETKHGLFLDRTRRPDGHLWPASQLAHLGGAPARQHPMLWSLRGLRHPAEWTPRPAEWTPRPAEWTPRPVEWTPRPAEWTPRPGEWTPRCCYGASCWPSCCCSRRCQCPGGLAADSWRSCHCDAACHCSSTQRTSAGIAGALWRYHFWQ